MSKWSKVIIGLAILLFVGTFFTGMILKKTSYSPVHIPSDMDNRVVQALVAYAAGDPLVSVRTVAPDIDGALAFVLSTPNMACHIEYVIGYVYQCTLLGQFAY